MLTKYFAQNIFLEHYAHNSLFKKCFSKSTFGNLILDIYFCPNPIKILQFNLKSYK